MEIERENNSTRIKVTGDNKRFIETQSVEANLLFDILQLLKDIHLQLHKEDNNENFYFHK